jgi:membrane protease YdiL (CAAX protease family)
VELPHPESPMPDDKPAVLARQSLFREVPWRWSDVLIGFAPMAVMTVASVLVNPAWLPVGPHWLWLPFMALSLAWTLGYPLWVVRRHCQLPRLPRPRTFFVEALFALFGTVVTMVVVAVVFSVLISLFGERAAITMPLRPIAESSYWYDPLALLFLSIVGAPVAEEVFFRGMLYSALRQRLPVIVAALLQAAVFGLSHRFGPADTVGVALIGVGIALLYEWRRTLIAPMLMHSMVNALAMLVMAQSIAATPRLGVIGENHTRGCVIKEVVPHSAADQAGLHLGDVIVKFDGEPIPDFASLVQAVRKTQVGQTVVVEVIRGREVQRVDVVMKKLRE